MDQQYNYQQPQKPAGAGNGLSIAALVLGIIGAVFGFIPVVTFFIATPCALLGLIFGVVGMVQSKKVTGKPSGLAIAGFVLGILGIAFVVTGIIVVISIIS